MDPREHLAGLVLAALFSTLLGAPAAPIVDPNEAAVMAVSIASPVARVQ